MVPLQRLQPSHPVRSCHLRPGPLRQRQRPLGEALPRRGVPPDGCEPIPPERLEILPGTRRCVKCQNAAELGDARDEPEFCPKCGSLVELRVSRGAGITRYKRVCTGVPPCRL